MLLPTLLHASGTCTPASVTSYGYDNSRANYNPNECVLKASSIAAHQFTVTRSAALTGIVYGQPLYQYSSPGMIFVATEENRAYSLNASTLVTNWVTNLNLSNETAIPDAKLPGIGGCDNINPEVGVTGTPVLDLVSNIPNVIYMVSKHITTAGVVTQRLNALNTATGMPIAPALDIGSAFLSNFATVIFDPLYQNQRAGLALTKSANGSPLVYVAWGSHCDTLPYNGIVGVFTLTQSGGTYTLGLVGAFDDEGYQVGKNPSYPNGGIWMSGAAPAIDDLSSETSPSGDLYLASGNGPVNSGVAFGESVMRLHYSGTNTLLTVAGLYTPNAWLTLNNGSTYTGVNLNLPAPYAPGTTIASPGDFDLGSGGVMLARPMGSGFLQGSDNFVVLAGGKEGVIYVNSPSAMLLNTVPDTVDPCSTTGLIQCFGAITLPSSLNGNKDYGNRGSAAFWPGSLTSAENVLYVARSQDTLIRGYQMASLQGGKFTTTQIFGSAPGPVLDNGGLIRYPGSSPVVSWNLATGTASDALLWILDTSSYQRTGQAPGVAKLFAYQATPSGSGGMFMQEFSDQTRGPAPTKFMVPLVVNAHIYVAGQQPGSSACAAGNCFGQVVSWY